MSTGPARSMTKRPTSVSGPPSARASLSRSTSSMSTTGAAKSANLRSTVPLKPVPPARRPTVNRASSVPSSSRTDSPAPIPDDGPQINGASVNGETFDTAKEELHAQIQDLDGTISSLTKENTNLQSTLLQAETRVNELYADQARWEEELAKRLQLTDNLRSQLREVEKEKRELTKRYNDQTTAFDAERQAFYDNEQHLKSRIQALSQARKDDHSARPPRRPRHQVDDDAKSVVSEAEYPPPLSPEPFDALKTPRVIRRGASSETSSRDESEIDENEPAEMTALKLELSTLGTSHTSLQSSMQLLQAQLHDLQRVNAALQDENEGWSVLVQQRTLAGTFDISGLGPTKQEMVESPNNGGTEDDVVSINSMRSGRSTGKGTLDRVSELEELAYEASQHDKEAELDPELDPDASAPQTRSLASELDPSVIGEEKTASIRSRRRPLTNGASSPAGESLANLPITGPGLDLAAELGRAENSRGFVLGDPPKPSGKKSKQEEGKGTKFEVEALRVEVKALKDANKALSLYASKIIDRITTMEGFENVLAVDFQAPTPTAGSTSGVGKFFSAITSKKPAARSTTSLFGGKATTPAPAPQTKLTTFETFRLGKSPASAGPPAPAPAPEPAKVDNRRSRRSLSFDFRGLFGSSASQTEPEKRMNDPSLKPLTLRPGSTSLNPNALPANAGAKKLETTEDDDDRKERERLRATMRLMGIEPGQPVVPPPIIHSHSEPPPQTTALEPPLPSFDTGGTVVSVGAPPPSVPPTPSKWHFFRRNTDNTPGSNTPPTSLTAEALEQAEAESHIAALDARERVMKDEIAKGSGSGFTEISGLRDGNGGTRRSLGEEWRSRRSSASLTSLGGTDGLKGLGVKPSPSLSRGPGSDAGSIGQSSLLFNAEDVHDD